MPKISSKSTLETTLDTSSKTTIKKPVKKILKKPEAATHTEQNVAQTKPTSDTTEIKMQSYVPKITHFKTAKKVSNPEPNLESTQEPENMITAAEQDQKIVDTLPEISKLETLKKNFKDLNNIKSKPDLASKTTKTSQSNFGQTISQSTPKTEAVTATIAQKSSQNPLETQLQPQEITKPKAILPSFLNRGFRQNQAKSENLSQITSQNSKISQAPVNESHNSLTSIFTRDKDEIDNIKRVFRKSIVFLTVSLLSFGLSSLASSNFTLQSLLALVFTSFGFIALTNIFFIIVAHRTYVWLFLLGQFLILAITQFPYSTSLSTLIVGLLTVMLTYLAYLDLEKVQLGSRLFSIPYIVGESTKILTTAIILIITLSAFNQIEAKGVDKFIGDSVLSIPIVLERAAIPLYQSNYLKSANLDLSQDSQTTVKALICAERKLNCTPTNRTVLSVEEYAKIQNECKTNGTGESGCEAIVEAAQTVVLNNYLNQDLPNLGLTLDSKLGGNNYQLALRQLIQNKIQNFADPARLSFLPDYIPAKAVVPFTVSLVIFILLSIFKFIFVWIGYIVTWILWKLLQITGFVRLDIEMVEAEIVGI